MNDGAYGHRDEDDRRDWRQAAKRGRRQLVELHEQWCCRPKAGTATTAARPCATRLGPSGGSARPAGGADRLKRRPVGARRKLRRPVRPDPARRRAGAGGRGLAPLLPWPPAGHWGLDLATSMALLPTAAPAALSERFLATVAAMLITTGRVQVADAAAALQVDASAVSTAVAQLAERLAAVGSRRSMTVSPSLAVLAHAAEAAGRIRALEAVSSLTTEAVMTLVIVGHLEEATRRDVDERRGADSTNVLAAAPRARSTVETPARRHRTTPAPSPGLRSRRRGTKGRG